jgi:methionine-rich copper-binding protein CopC
MNRACKLILLAVILLANSVMAQTTGDYRSVVNGNWGVAGTWETYNGSAWVAASSVPPVVPPYANITIQAGDTVIVEASPKRAASLKVEGTAYLYANSSTNRYIRLWGNVTNDGTVGGTSDGLCYMCSTNVFLSGMGSTNISRLQVASAGVSVTIDRPITLHYAGAALYGNNVDNITYTVGTNGQVDFGPTSFVSITTNSTNPSPYNATYNIAGGGFVLQTGMNFNMSVRSGKKSVLNLSGGLTLGNPLIAYSDSAGTEVVNINEGGVILLSSTDSLRFDSLNINVSSSYSPPTPAIIKGGLGLVSGDYVNGPATNLRFDKNAKIDRVLGTLANKPIFTDTVNLIYSGTAPCTTSYEMPYLSDNTVVNLTVNHEITLDSTRYVNDVEANGGPIIAGDKSFGVFGGYGKNSADGYVIGFMGRPVIVWGATQQLGFMVGTANGFSPAIVSISGVTKAGLMGCRALEGVHPEAFVPQETMQRQWTIGWHPDSAADYESASLKLYYLPEDFNTSFTEAEDESTMVMGTVGQDDSTWTFLPVITRIYNGINDGGMVEGDELEPFPAMFTMAKSKYSLAGDVEPPVITGTYPANGATGVALDTQIWLAFSEPMDTLSLAGDMQPGAGNHVVWNPTMDTLTLTHDLLSPATTYILSLTAITDLAGNPLAVLPDSFSFTTIIGDTIKPYVVSTYPAGGATEVDLDSQIYITFSEPMDTLSLVGSMTPSPNEQPAWSSSMDTLFLPHDPMSVNTSYTIKLTALNDLGGNPLVVLPDSFSFTTIVGDTVKPYIVDTYPADGAVDVPQNQAVIIVFSEPINQSSFMGYSSPYHEFTLSWNAASDTLTLTPDTLYQINTTYTIYDTAGVDTAGNKIAGLPVSFSFTTTPTGVEGDPGAQNNSFFLSPASPNPVRNSAEFRFGLAKDQKASLEIYNVLGQRVKSLVNGNLPAGNHKVKWNGCDQNGRKVSSGVYVYRLITGDNTYTRRFTVIR